MVLQLKQHHIWHVCSVAIPLHRVCGQQGIVAPSLNTIAGIIVPSPIESYLVDMYMDQQTGISPAERSVARTILSMSIAELAIS